MTTKKSKLPEVLDITTQAHVQVRDMNSCQAFGSVVNKTKSAPIATLKQKMVHAVAATLLCLVRQK